MNTKNKSTGKRRSCLGCLGRGVLGLLALLVVMIIAGTIYQSAASTSDAKKYPPPGELYDVGEYQLHLYCTGEGSPTVILEAGAGSPGLIWTYVQPEIAKSMRVCSYDRAGFGWSDSALGPLSPQQVATDLHTLLQSAQVTGPYILVGHSVGGVYVRAFTNQYPAEVVGMVLVDSTHEEQNVRFPQEYREINKYQSAMVGFCRFVSPFGGMRVTRFFDMATSVYNMDVETGQVFLSTMYRTNYCRAVVEETEALAAPLGKVGSPGSLGDLPLIVLTAETSPEEMMAQIPAYLQSIVGPEAIKQVFEVSRELQKELVGLSSQGKQIMVTNSGHLIQLDQPEVVIDAIRKIVEQVRGE
jgi:pimeloyl-ACP methyl ester carboxylesterase